MPKLMVNGVNLHYELFGKGPETFVWNTAGWFARGTLPAYLILGRLCQNYRVLFWDRRNIGESDLLIEDAPSEGHLWVDDMHHLLQALHLSPAYFGGRSSGHIFSLLMAHRYPEDVKGLVLMDAPISAENDIIRAFQYANYHHVAEVAETGGMQAALEHVNAALLRIASGRSDPNGFDWLTRRWADCLASNPLNRERFLQMDPAHFATILRRWGDWNLSNPLNRAGLSSQELSRIVAPALILPGADDIHPRHVAEEVYRLLPNAEWVEYTDRYPQERIEAATKSDRAGIETVALSLPFIADFLNRLENCLPSS